MSQPAETNRQLTSLEPGGCSRGLREQSPGPFTVTLIRTLL